MSSVDGTRSLQYASDEVFENTCSPCHYSGTVKEATHFCEDCKERLCQGCTDSHKGLRMSRNHKLVVIKNIVPQPGTVYNIFCGCSMNLEVTVYCEDHADVICLSCKTLTHGKCKTVLISQKCVNYTPTKLTRVAQKANALKEETDAFLKERQTDLQQLTAMKEQCKNDIKAFRKQLAALFDFIEQNTLKELGRLELQQRQDIERNLSTFTTTKQMVEADEKLLNDALKSSEKINMFAADVKISKRFNDYEKLLQGIRHEIKSPAITFERHKELTELQSKVADLGTLTTGVADAFRPRALLFTDMKIRSSSQIDLKMSSDSYPPSITGCAFLPDGQALLCDSINTNIILLSSAFAVTEVLQLPSDTWDVSVLSHSKAVTTLPLTKQIQFLQTVPKLKTERMIQLDKQCWGVEVAGEEIYVTCYEYRCNGEVRVLDMAGHCKRRIGANEDRTFMFKAPSHLTVNASTATLFVSDLENNTVTRLKADISKYEDTKIKEPRGICVDGKDNVIVCSQISNEVHVVTADGLNNKILLSPKDGIKEPCCVAYNDGSLIVGSWRSTKLFVFKVE